MKRMVKVNCSDCQEILFTPNKDIDLRIVRSADGSVSEESCYSFVCPECEVLQTNSVDKRDVDLLVKRGVNIDEVTPHPESPLPDGPPFTYDDLLDFHLLLKKDDWFSHVI